MSAKHPYFPERNPRAYSTEALTARLRVLIAQRAAKNAIPNSERWAETMLTVTELRRRRQSLALCGLALQDGPEAHASAGRPRVDYPIRKAA